MKKVIHLAVLLWMGFFHERDAVTDAAGGDDCIEIREL